MALAGGGGDHGEGHGAEADPDALQRGDPGARPGEPLHARDEEELVRRDEQEAHGDEIGLELTLGFQPVTPRVVARSPPAGARFGAGSSSEESGHIGLLLELPVA